MAFKRWLYSGGHPNALARLLNRGWAMFHSLGFFPNYMVTLEVTGRRSGKPVSFPLAMTVVNGERYLVSMLGKSANWVQNIRVAGGQAVLKHGLREEVLLEELPVPHRAEIIKAYLKIAPGARPHIPVDPDAPLADFQKIAPDYPVFIVHPRK